MLLRFVVLEHLDVCARAPRGLMRHGELLLVLLLLLVLPSLSSISSSLPEVQACSAPGGNFGEVMMDSDAPAVVRGAGRTLGWDCFKAWQDESFMAAAVGPALKVHVSAAATTRLHAVAHPLVAATVAGSGLNVTWRRPFVERVVSTAAFLRGKSSNASEFLTFFAPLANMTAALGAGVGAAAQLTDGFRPVLEKNLWMAAPGMTTPAHYDGAHNCFVQVRGAKAFTLLPPAAWRALHLYPRVHPSSRQAPESEWGALELAPLGALRVTVRAGDLLYIPPFWFHRVEAVEKEGGEGGEGGGVSISVSVHTESRHMDIVAGVRKFSIPMFGGLDHSQRVEMLRLYVSTIVVDLALLNAQQEQQQQQPKDDEDEVPVSEQQPSEMAEAEVEGDGSSTAPAAAAPPPISAEQFIPDLLRRRYGHLVRDAGVQGLAAVLATSRVHFAATTERLPPLPDSHPVARVVHSRAATFAAWCRKQIYIEQAAWEIVLGDHIEDIVASLLGPLSVEAFLAFMAGELPLRPIGSAEAETRAFGGTNGGALGAGVRLVKYWETTQSEPGATAVPGDTVSIHYTAWLADSDTGQVRSETPFDSSHNGGDSDGGEPFSFRVGSMQVIPGMDRAVRSMAQGQRVTVFIPSAQGYGSKGAGDGDVVPPYADLLFDIELLSVQPAAAAANK